MPKILKSLKFPTFLHQSYFLAFAALGVISGAILALIFRINFFASPIWLVAAAAALFVAYLKPRTALAIVALLSGMVLSFFRVASELKGEDYIRQFYGQTVIISGAVAGDPNSDESGTKFKLKDLKFGDEKSGKIKSAAGTIYITTKSTPALARSDRVELKGELSSGFGVYAGYLYKPAILKISRPDPGDLILKVRNTFAARIKSTLKNDQTADLGLSYLLGMKTDLDDGLSENLRLVGLVHLVVASGAHLSILVDFTRKVFGKFSRMAGLILSVIFVLFFMVLVGFTPSILRAGIMAILSLIAWYTGRKIAPWRLITLVAAATLLMNPMFIIDLGWLLSFASFAGIMILMPILIKFLYGDKKPGFIASGILVTVSATLMTAPITLYFFGTISLISVVANLIILPTLPVAMGLTFLAGLAAGLPLLEPAINFCTNFLLNFHIAVVDFFAEQKSFLISIDQYQPQVFYLYIPVVIILIIGLLREKMVKLKQAKHQKWEKYMSGHSKWATTKRQKAVVDAKRGALFTKIGNQIAIAARSGTDPAMNPSLAMVLDKARHANMPKANIERAIARAADKSAAALIEETYEAYGPGGVGIVIEVATDNKNRTMPEVRHTLDKNGGRMADPGSVMFQFERKGVIMISERGEDALMAALEAGAEDATEEDDGTEIITAASDLMKVRDALKDNLTITSAELQYVPNSYIPVEGETAEKLNKLLDAVDDLDDVVNVYTNAE